VAYIPPDKNPLRRARLRRGWSQVELAARADISLGTVSLCERGGFLTHAMARRLAPVLGVQPSDLLPPERAAGGES